MDTNDTCIGWDVCYKFHNVAAHCYSEATSIAYPSSKPNELERLELISSQLDEIRRCLHSLVMILSEK